LHPVKTGLIGAGVFGGYHAQKLTAIDAADFVGVFDPDPARCEALAGQHGVIAFDSSEALLDAVDAVLIASPAHTHALTVEQALKAKVHVLVEKPLALDGATALHLAKLAENRHLILQVGHQERAVFDAIGLLAAPERPIHVACFREGPVATRCLDVSVIMDLMIHDLDLVARLLGADATLVQAEGQIAYSGKIDAAHGVFQFADGARADLRASRNAPERRRGMKVVYPSGTFEVDFLTRQSVDTTGFLDAEDLNARVADPLMAADAAFIRAVAGQGQPYVSGREAAEAVALADTLETHILTRLSA
jgi:predicted dehydrogenase